MIGGFFGLIAAKDFRCFLLNAEIAIENKVSPIYVN